MSLPEVETPASRVLYINSKDATTRYGPFDTDFDFSLEEPIAVPPHHIILLSLYSAEIPYSFYYFDTGHNTRITIQITSYGNYHFGLNNHIVLLLLFSFSKFLISTHFS